jgi:hypothetical protein
MFPVPDHLRQASGPYRRPPPQRRPSCVGSRDANRSVEGPSQDLPRFGLKLNIRPGTLHTHFRAPGVSSPVSRLEPVPQRVKSRDAVAASGVGPSRDQQIRRRGPHKFGRERPETGERQASGVGADCDQVWRKPLDFPGDTPIRPRHAPGRPWEASRKTLPPRRLPEPRFHVAPREQSPTTVPPVRPSNGAIQRWKSRNAAWGAMKRAVLTAWRQADENATGASTRP